MCEHLWIVHVPLQDIPLCVEDEISPLEAAAVLLLLDVQEAAHTVQAVQIWHRCHYHIITETQRQRQADVEGKSSLS